MRTFRFILLILITLASVGAAVLLTIDGNLSRIIGAPPSVPENGFSHTPGKK